jgi:hypothetical protein
MSVTPAQTRPRCRGLVPDDEQESQVLMAGLWNKEGMQ